MLIRQDRQKKTSRVVVTSPNPRETLEKYINGFIDGFPQVGDFKYIFVIVDRFSKCFIFMSTPNTCPTEEATKLFFSHVVKYFRLPKNIVNYHDA